ncbi:hypothetical protein [Fibrobacter sp. UWB11]|uniref:hypothetical protein n=1 Tax=Fibrobacter sp. UWB11 TaxID=1896202 RepID=UPI000926176D|nr:hypothetical protein [Fibrobacter sp. UWB11]SIO03788.1 hypothetical protein SAMN05720758_1123 [Fibrobacter sp. UWB11]
MLKKAFLISATAALVFSACGSDNSASPSGSGPQVLSCSANAISDDTFIMEVVTENVTMTTTTTIAGNLANIEYDLSYAPEVPAAYVQQDCDDNKKEAEEKNAQIICSDHSIIIKEVQPADISFEDALKSAENSCRQMIH